MNLPLRDEFLSPEDLDLRSLTPEERDRVWDAWLRQAQTTNQQDQHLYSHGVFTHEPPWLPPNAQHHARPNSGGTASCKTS